MDLTNKSNYDLRYILRYVTDENIRNRAWEMLAQHVGLTEVIDQDALIRKIAKEALSRPGSLKQELWHCGTSHCVAGWATLLHPEAKRIEMEYDTAAAGYAVLPKYSHLFFKDTDEVIEILRGIVA